MQAIFIQVDTLCPPFDICIARPLFFTYKKIDICHYFSIGICLTRFYSCYSVYKSPPAADGYPDAYFIQMFEKKFSIKYPDRSFLMGTKKVQNGPNKVQKLGYNVFKGFQWNISQVLKSGSSFLFCLTLKTFSFYRFYLPQSGVPQVIFSCLQYWSLSIWISGWQQVQARSHLFWILPVLRWQKSEFL